MVTLQQWLQERASLLRYTYTACLVQLRMSEKKERLHLCTELTG